MVRAASGTESDTLGFYDTSTLSSTPDRRDVRMGLAMHPKDLQIAESRWRGPRGLAVRWLGTAGFELEAPDGVLLVDPYLTRVGLWRFLTQRLAPDEARISREIGRADGVLVGHSHFDHVMDVPVIAKRTGAKVFGSQSTANLMAASGLPERQRVELPKDRRTTFEVGPFKVTAVPSVHSTFAVGKKVPYAGDIPCTCEISLRGRDYRCGDVFNYLIEYGDFRMYHMGSANLVEDAIPAEAKGADLFFMCIAARFATPDYTSRALRVVAPRKIIPMHYDNMFRAAEKPMWLLPRTAFGKYLDEVSAVSRSFELMTLPLVTTPATQADNQQGS